MENVAENTNNQIDFLSRYPYKTDNNGHYYTNHGIVPGIMSFTILGNSFGSFIAGSGIFTGKSRNEKLRMCGITSSTMGPAEAKAAGLITPVTFNQTGGTRTLEMNKYVAADFQAICNEILALGWFKLYVGNSYRSKNSVSNGISRHCWGIAVDINPGNGGNPWFDTHISRSMGEPAYGSRPWPMKKCSYSGGYDKTKCIWHYGHPVVQIFESHGWGWGGAYGDVMHFSVDDGH